MDSKYPSLKLRAAQMSDTASEHFSSHMARFCTPPLKLKQNSLNFQQIEHIGLGTS